jgi:hypothetical protein
MEFARCLRKLEFSSFKIYRNSQLNYENQTPQAGWPISISLLETTTNLFLNENLVLRAGLVAANEPG